MSSRCSAIPAIWITLATGHEKRDSGDQEVGTSLSWGMSRLFQYRHPQLQSMLKLCNLKITRFSSRTWKNIVISLPNFVSIIPTLCRITRYKLDITITEGYNAPAQPQTISEAVQKNRVASYQE